LFGLGFALLVVCFGLLVVRFRDLLFDEALERAPFFF
jgi:hypothetical protein